MIKISLKILFLLVFLLKNDFCNGDLQLQQHVVKLVKMWSNEIGKELYRLSMTMSRKEKVAFNFKPLKENVYKEDGGILIQNVASEMREMMEKKVDAVKNIAEYAEFLAFHRDTAPINTSAEGPFQFFNTNNITNIDPDRFKDKEIQEYIREGECTWWCYQNPLEPLDNNQFTKERIARLFVGKDKEDIMGKECDCNSLPSRIRPLEWFNDLPMIYDKNFKTSVNHDISAIKIAANIYHRDPDVLQGIRWSEALDLIFKENAAKDPTLSYQFFTSPLGYMRHYPAVQWEDEQYLQTYDPRTRSWYTEAMTSPKDIIILLDRSGSMRGQRKKLSHHVVNNILDTLNDNDFVNIYTFTNTTEPLVHCFQDTLVQANEENLRLLRESLNLYPIKFAADLSIGVRKAFEILQQFRDNQLRSSHCNQAIMLITEGIDYDFHTETFNYYNWMYNSPVRIFTYLLSTLDEESKYMEWIACANRGYFVNITLMEEVREKVLTYMNVMSRPVNSHYFDKQRPIWSYLQIDLADRRYSNWLWKQFEGNRQRQVFLDHVKRLYMRTNKILTSENHMLLQETHTFESYQGNNEYNYLTTVSLPVYGRRKSPNTTSIFDRRTSGDYDLIGVAGIDVPIKLLYSLVPHYKIGVNGYAFILTNNGYILMHPGHRREFENIPKPTFNRVDLLEIEILDDDAKPRQFSEQIVKLREKIVQQDKRGYVDLKVKFPLDNMKRVMLSERRYYNTDIGPFSLGIALHHKYGLMVVNNTNIRCDNLQELKRMLEKPTNWTVHPQWVYCKNSEGDKPSERVLNCIDKLIVACQRRTHKRKEFELLASFLFDANATRWFNDRIVNENLYRRKYLVTNVFLATYTGLTRWKNFENEDLLSRRESNDDDGGTDNDVDRDDEIFDDGDNFETNMNFTAIDEDWYIRTVEENYKNENMFIYSVPFEISGYENNTLITSTNAIFVRDSRGKFPAAVVGLQFNSRAMNNLYKSITTTCLSPTCEVSCESDYLTCFILDNNAYVILADEVEYTGRFIGNIRPDIMYHLIRDGVYKPTQMFDYQAICQKLIPEQQENRSSRLFTIRKYLENLLELTNWALATILYFVKAVFAEKKYQSIKPDTLAFEKLEINKTVPTPCDQMMWLFTMGNTFKPNIFSNKTSKFDCSWAYVVDKIPNSNLLFMAINNLCKVDTVNVYHNSPTPIEIEYDDNLPCYIATHNKFSRKIYMNCYNRSREDDKLNQEDRYYCGRTW